MLVPEENQRLTGVGPGSAAGELLRRYWHPIALRSDVSPESPTKSVRLLGEDLVLFLSLSGSLGLVGERCSHRGASLLYGFPEENGIRCPYHGWQFAESGECVDQPFEENKPSFRDQCRISGYAVEEKAGIVFAYLGPQHSRPLLPGWDILSRKEVSLRFEIQENLSCNWLQLQENAADPVHTFFLHSGWLSRLGEVDNSRFNRPWRKFGFQVFPWGLLKSWEYGGADPGRGWGNLLVFPNILRLETEMHWRVPVDDETTRVFWISIDPEGVPGQLTSVVQAPHQHRNGRYTMADFPSQDSMACETQGAIVDRSVEKLGRSDAGIVMYRNMLKREINAVAAGEDPLGTVRDEADNEFIDLRVWFGGDRAMSCDWDDGLEVQRLSEAAVFDSTHMEFVVSNGVAFDGLKK